MDRADRKSLADLPLFFGNWNSVFKRYRDWVKAGVFIRLFEACSDEPDMEYAMVDATIVKVHRHGQGAKGDAEPGDRPLQGRHDDQNTRADRRARQSGPLRPAARPPFRYGRRRSADRRIAFGGLIADKAFDSNAIIANLNERGAKIVISQHPRRALPLRLDTELYKWRHLIENFFCKLKEFKRIAMRADKTDQSFAAIIHLAAAVINSR